MSDPNYHDKAASNLSMRHHSQSEADSTKQGKTRVTKHRSASVLFLIGGEGGTIFVH